MGRRRLCATFAILALAGCGVGDDRERARAAVERFYAAVRAGDGSAACGELSAAARSQLESQSGKDCEAIVTRLDYRGGAVVATEVAATSAKVDVRGGESAFLDREPVGWRISALACVPAGDRAEDPFDCEVEA
jgi:hypothetical protein